jgi:hypothetical protein
MTYHEWMDSPRRMKALRAALTWPKPDPRERHWQRNVQMAISAARGETLTGIARRHKVSIPRVHQIVVRTYQKVWRIDTGRPL